jgi:hypothetical protein
MMNPNEKENEMAETPFFSTDDSYPSSQKMLTFQQYVDEKWNLQTLGPYDYMAFCKMMKTPEFLDSIKKGYQNKMRELSIENGDKHNDDKSDKNTTSK